MTSRLKGLGIAPKSKNANEIFQDNGDDMRQIAFYGKGGIGKSTVLSNVTATLSKNHKILQIGCDPKADSTKGLLHHKKTLSVLDLFKAGESSNLHSTSLRNEILHTGFGGVDCIEAGGPEPGVGCAGRGIIKVMEILKDNKIFNNDYDFVFYDVLGDVVCGGFAMPIREGFAKEIYLVVSGELMAIFAANNICKGIKRFTATSGSKLGGIICNKRNVKMEEAIVEDFAHQIGSKVISVIPRSDDVQVAEHDKMTAVEKDPNSDVSKHYATLAYEIVKNDQFIVPRPLSDDELTGLFERYRS